jgi:hypothetical protein
LLVSMLVLIILPTAQRRLVEVIKAYVDYLIIIVAKGSWSKGVHGYTCREIAPIRICGTCRWQVKLNLILNVFKASSFLFIQVLDVLRVAFGLVTRWFLQNVLLHHLSRPLSCDTSSSLGLFIASLFGVIVWLDARLPVVGVQRSWLVLATSNRGLLRAFLPIESGIGFT